ncbi:Response regulator protein VraR [Zhongshania aliphaticivorans]|uniref:Response regulator protein VraR n=1 Tax=Zhongshania aliphaticivorans TaxID=1470434 RepID=A0A5S9PT09_9GAMM|nr:response regulator transcription factor [Zhongshania aliphaticivorans]CAA0107256.1 Response regulator protein VraR [Zhongshania aliphaticivorans]CAA0107326.1 Response regulator protein VraR [Zhongshania aliphaticivorans]
MTICVYSRSNAFSQHIGLAVTGRPVVYQDTLLGPASDASPCIDIIHASSFSPEAVAAFLKTASSGDRRLAIADDIPSATALLGYTQGGALAYCNSYMASDHFRQLFALLDNGASWYPPVMLTEIFNLARKNMASDQPLSPLFDALTDRERQVALRVAEGKSNKEVAVDFNITVRTVKAHLSNIYEKLQVKDRVALLIYLQQNGIH